MTTIAERTSTGVTRIAGKRLTRVLLPCCCCTW
jgi:hypothetical protein